MTAPAQSFSLTRTLPLHATAEALRADVLRGLGHQGPKHLPPKWFYDARGSELFEEITRLPEYYPTRAEREILTDRADEIAAATGARTLVELGSGSAEKARLLIDALPLTHYVPVDVSASALEQAADELLADFPGLEIHALIADFQAGLELPGTPGPRVIAFLGGTFGNLLPTERAGFLATIRALLSPGDAFLLGTDLVKDETVLVNAYDDSAGVTAAFNKNVLAVLNSELNADFDPDSFDHVARWNADQEWIEMRLRARTAQTVQIPALDLTVEFAAGEEMRTEVSAKFRRERLQTELAVAGMELQHWWTDREGRFALSLATVRPA